MRKISAFLFISLNGCYKKLDDDISWHFHGEEGNQLSIKQLNQDNILLFGRKTYDLMSNFWPTKNAFNAFPEVAQRMNDSEKIVLSSSLNNVEWSNTTIISDIDQIKKLKNSYGKDITLLGSGSILTQLTESKLIDEYQFLIDSVVLENGVPIFDNIKSKVELIFGDVEKFERSSSLFITAKLNCNDR